MAEIYGKGMVAWCEVVMLYHGGGRDDYNGVGVPPQTLGVGVSSYLCMALTPNGKIIKGN